MRLSKTARSPAALAAWLALLLAGARSSRAQVVLGQFAGASANEFAGSAVAFVGDLDGDGRDDLVVGAPFADPGGVADAGVVRAYAGGTGALLGALGGTAAGELFGQGVAGPGDVTGDGVADLLVGSPSANVAALAGAGQARLFSGANGAVVHLWDGLFAQEELGWTFDALGDLDGDGRPEILAAAPHTPFGAIPHSGSVRVFSGASGGTLYAVTGTAFSGHFGWSVSRVGDQNGDGFEDFLVGAMHEPSGGMQEAGRVHFFSGITGTALATFGGSAPYERFGQAVAGVGDVNGDGFPDFAIGAPGASPGGMNGAGRVFVASVAGGVLFAFDGAAPLDACGQAVARAGDVNADGYDDVLVGLPGADAPGAADAGRVVVLAGPSGSVLYSTFGTGAGDAFGTALAGAGDASGDGFADFAMGAPFADPGGLSNAGTTTLFSGAPPGVVAYGAGCGGSGGLVPKIGATGTPSPGSTFTVHLSRALGATPAFLALGTSNSSWNGVPLPANLSLFGMPACDLLVAPEIVLFAATSGPPASGAGKASVALALPPDPTMSGTDVYLQWYAADPGPGLVPGAWTRALRATVR